ncbi:MAG TPA: protein-disulfide reductase DsbD N-terminal domain-containing protein [Burkholderiales bacterium]
MIGLLASLLLAAAPLSADTLPADGVERGPAPETSHNRAELPLQGLVSTVQARSGADFLIAPPAAAPVDPERAFQVQVAALARDTLGVRFTIDECCYLYREQLRFDITAPNGAPAPRLRAVSLPPAEIVTDEFFGRTAVYRGTVDLRLSLEEPAARGFTLHVTYQGCSEKGVVLCYEPMIRRFPVERENGRLAVGPGSRAERARRGSQEP